MLWLLAVPALLPAARADSPVLAALEAKTKVIHAAVQKDHERSEG